MSALTVEHPGADPGVTASFVSGDYFSGSKQVLWAKVIDVLCAAEKELEGMHQMLSIILFALRDNTHAFGINLW